MVWFFVIVKLAGKLFVASLFVLLAVSYLFFGKFTQFFLLDITTELLTFGRVPIRTTK